MKVLVSSEQTESRPNRLCRPAVWKRVITVLLLAFTAACATYHPVSIEAAPQELSVGDSVRFKAQSGQKHQLRIADLDIAGFGDKQEHFLFGEVSDLELRRFSVGKSLGFYMAIGLVGFLTIGSSLDFDGLGG